MAKYWVKWKWEFDTDNGTSVGEGQEFVTTDNLESWWLDYKDEVDELTMVVKL